MYKHRSRPIKPGRPWLALATPVVVVGLTGTSFAFLLPDSSKPKNARVFAEGLKIELDRSSPAYAALEDAWMNANQSRVSLDSEPAHKNTVTLTAGTESAQNVAMRILRENGREKALIAQERAAREYRRQVQAATTVVDASDARAAGLVSRTLEAQKLIAIRNKQAAAIPSDVQEHQNVSGAEVYVHPTRTISLSDLQMSRDELASALMLPIATAGGDLKQINTAKALMLPNAVKGVSSVREGGSRERAFDAVSVDTLDRTAKVEPDSSSGEIHRQVVMTGPIEFSGGLALSHSLDRVVVYREQDGEAIEQGSVWIREGRYEIFVEETSGVLVGEMRTPYGDVLGRGLVDLSKAQMRKMSDHKLGPVRMIVSAIPQGVSGVAREVPAPRDTQAKVSSKPSLTTDIRFRDLPFQTQSDTKGRFEEKSLLEGSNVILQANKHAHWQTIVHARAGIENEIQLYDTRPGSRLAALLEKSEMRESQKREAGIVIGRVTRRGAPVAGATVELLTTVEVVAPVYLDASMKPDLRLKATSESGYYAFLPVIEGAHAVEVKMGLHASDPRIFAVNAGSVSQVDVEIGEESRAKLKVFDAFRTDWPLAAVVRPPGSIKEARVANTGEGEWRVAKGSDPLILDVDGGTAYENVRLTNDRNRRLIYAPMIQSKWLESVRSNIKLNKEPRTGAIIGFIQGSLPYRVSMEERSVLPSSRIVYFNSRGEVTGSDAGEPGGGFVIFNVPEGMRVVGIQPSGTTKTFVSTVLVETNVTNVINHWVR